MDRRNALKVPNTSSFVWVNKKIGLSDTNFGRQSIFILDGAKMRDDETVLTEFRSQLNLPEGMGYNFDSLDECLDQFDWPDTKQFILILKNTQLFIDNCDKKVVEIVFSMLEYAAQSWQKERNDDYVFCVVLDKELAEL